MSDVEELCERVALIADSHLLLYGELDQIKRKRGANSVQVQAHGIPAGYRNGRKELPANGIVEYAIGEGRTPEMILRSYLEAEIPIERFELLLPSLNDIFIEEVSRARAAS
jgi:ABC-2 type transport system ATP-binding protein